MTFAPKYSALVPIRSGSKSIPNKNIRELCGKPLFYWATKAAIDSGVFNGGVYVAVDSEEYFSLVQSVLPDAIPVMRPAETATDTASSESVLLWFVENFPCDVVSLVQATTPTVTARDFRDARNQFEDQGGDSLLTAVAFSRFIWTQGGIPLNYDPLRRPRRQDFQPSCVENGAFYFTKIPTLQATKCRLGGRILVHVMPEESFVEIDEPNDWAKVAAAMQLVWNPTEVSRIKAVVIDVDGTLTDGGMYYGFDGEALKKFNTRDGVAISQLMNSGFEVLVCTGENSRAVDARIEKLRIRHYLKGVDDKVKAISGWLSDHQLGWSNVLYVGDELNDLEALKRAAYSICPRDAHPEVARVARKVSEWNGGEGVVRTVVDHLKGEGYIT